VKIPVNRPLLDGNEAKYLQECIESGWISSEGPFVSQFESAFADKVGRKYGVAVSSGTAALDIAFELLDLQPGDEVILPTFTIISCVHQIMRRGAIPVLIDSDPDTWNMDTSLIEDRITSRTRAILIVHIYGLPVNMVDIDRISKKYALLIIEDAAEAHGLTFNGKPCGSFGDISTFSFYPNKLITTGEGGMIVTDSHNYATKSQSLRNLCFAKPRYVHEQIGWNYRMTNIQAAVGIAQLERWDEFLKRKKRLGALYTELLSNVEGIQLPITHTPSSENVYWVYGLVLNNGSTANQLIERLEQDGVGTRNFFCPLHLQPALLKEGLFTNEEYPIAERLWRFGFYLPCGVGILDDEVRQVADSVRNALSETNEIRI